MKIAIFADSHDNLANIDIFLDWIIKNNIDQVICCGDLTKVETLEFIAKQYQKPMHLVPGNADEKMHVANAVDSVQQAHYYDEFGEVVLDNLNMGFVHYPEYAERMAQTGKFDYIFHGHTHMPWRKVMKSCFVVNPGTLAGMFFRATFAVLDTESKHLELKIIDRLDE